MNSTSFVFNVWKTKKLKKAFAKEEEEIQEDVQRDSKVVRDCNECIQCVIKCKLRSCFYRLFMSGQENH